MLFFRKLQKKSTISTLTVVGLKVATIAKNVIFKLQFQKRNVIKYNFTLIFVSIYFRDIIVLILILL